MSVLLAELSRDHVPVIALKRLYERHHASPSLVSDLLAAIDHLDADLAHRAVWLLRRCVESGRFDTDDLARLIDHLDASDHWIYRLTLCQLLSAVALPENLRDQTFPFLERSFTDRRVIVRAWALTAMTRFISDRRFSAVIKTMLRAARRDPQKSMQARLRAIDRFLA